MRPAHDATPCGARCILPGVHSLAEGDGERVEPSGDVAAVGVVDRVLHRAPAFSSPEAPGGRKGVVAGSS